MHDAAGGTKMSQRPNHDQATTRPDSHRPRSVGASFSVVALAAAITAAVAAAPPQFEPQDPTFRERVDLVNVGVTVAGKKHQLVTDLTASDFSVYEDGKSQQIFAFASGAEEGPPLHVGVLLDVSSSQEFDLKFSQAAVIQFLRSLSDAADMTFIDFASDVRGGRYAQTDFPLLVERIRGLRAGGFTALYDAIGLYLTSAAEQDGRKVMVLFTDGGDTASKTSLDKLMKQLKASDATVYAIGLLDNQLQSEQFPQRARLAVMAEATGGTAFFPNRIKELGGIYDRILQEVRAQYTIGYVSTNEKTDGAWRKVEVKVTRPDAKGLRVRARKGYYASKCPKSGDGREDTLTTKSCAA
jgi:Ca-activated chloride channel family protein